MLPKRLVYPPDTRELPVSKKTHIEQGTASVLMLFRQHSV